MDQPKKRGSLSNLNQTESIGLNNDQDDDDQNDQIFNRSSINSNKGKLHRIKLQRDLTKVSERQEQETPQHIDFRDSNSDRKPQDRNSLRSKTYTNINSNSFRVPSFQYDNSHLNRTVDDQVLEEQSQHNLSYQIQDRSQQEAGSGSGSYGYDDNYQDEEEQDENNYQSRQQVKNGYSSSFYGDDTNQQVLNKQRNINNSFNQIVEEDFDSPDKVGFNNNKENLILNIPNIENSQIFQENREIHLEENENKIFQNYQHGLLEDVEKAQLLYERGVIIQNSQFKSLKKSEGQSIKLVETIVMLKDKIAQQNKKLQKYKKSDTILKNKILQLENKQNANPEDNINDRILAQFGNDENSQNNSPQNHRINHQNQYEEEVQKVYKQFFDEKNSLQTIIYENKKKIAQLQQQIDKLNKEIQEKDVKIKQLLYELNVNNERDKGKNTEQNQNGGLIIALKEQITLLNEEKKNLELELYDLKQQITTIHPNDQSINNNNNINIHFNSQETDQNNQNNSDRINQTQEGDEISDEYNIDMVYKQVIFVCFEHFRNFFEQLVHDFNNFLSLYDKNKLEEAYSTTLEGEIKKFISALENELNIKLNIVIQREQNDSDTITNEVIVGSNEENSTNDNTLQQKEDSQNNLQVKEYEQIIDNLQKQIVNLKSDNQSTLEENKKLQEENKILKEQNNNLQEENKNILKEKQDLQKLINEQEEKNQIQWFEIDEIVKLSQSNQNGQLEKRDKIINEDQYSQVIKKMREITQNYFEKNENKSLNDQTSQSILINEENKHIKQEIHELNEKKLQQISKEEEEEEQKQILQKQQEDKQKYLDDQQKQLDNKQIQLDDKQKQLDDKQAQLEYVQKQLENEQNKLNDLQKQLQSLQQQFDELQKQNKEIQIQQDKNLVQIQKQVKQIQDLQNQLESKQKQQERLTQQNEEQQKQINTLKLENNENKEKISNLDKQNDELKQKINLIISNVTQTCLTEPELNIQQLNQQQSLIPAMNILQDMIQQLNKLIQDNNKQEQQLIQKHKDDKKQLNHEIEQLKQTIINLQEQGSSEVNQVSILQQLKEASELEQKMMQEEVEKQQTQINQLKKQIEDLIKQIEEQSKTIQDLTNQQQTQAKLIDEQTKKNNDLNQSIHDKDNIITENIKTINEQTQTINNNKQKIEDQILDIINYQQEIKVHQYMIDHSQQTINEQKQIINQQIQQINDFDKQKMEQNQTITDQKLQINDLNKTISEQNKNTNEQNKIINEQNTIINELNKTITRNNIEISDQNKTIKELNKTIADLESKKDQIDKNNQQLIIQIQQLQQHFFNKNNDLIQSEKTISQLNEQIKSLQDEAMKPKQNSQQQEKIQSLTCQVQMMQMTNLSLVNEKSMLEEKLKEQANNQDKYFKDTEHFKSDCNYSQLIERLLINRNNISKSMFENISYFMREIHQNIQNTTQSFFVDFYQKVYEDLESSSNVFNQKSEELFIKLDGNQDSLIKMCNFYELIFQHFQEMLQPVLLLNAEMLRQQILPQQLENKLAIQ